MRGESHQCISVSVHQWMLLENAEGRERKHENAGGKKSCQLRTAHPGDFGLRKEDGGREELACELDF